MPISALLRESNALTNRVQRSACADGSVRTNHDGGEPRLELLSLLVSERRDSGGGGVAPFLGTRRSGPQLRADS